MRDIVERVLLTLTFVAGAVLKTKTFLIDGDWSWIAVALQSPTFVSGLVALEVLAAVLLWTRVRAFGCWIAIAFAVGGNLAVFLGTQTGGAACGCFGRWTLSAAQHAALSVGVFAVAAHQLVTAPVPPENPPAPRR